MGKKFLPRVFFSSNLSSCHCIEIEFCLPLFALIRNEVIMKTKWAADNLLSLCVVCNSHSVHCTMLATYAGQKVLSETF